MRDIGLYCGITVATDYDIHVTVRFTDGAAKRKTQMNDRIANSTKCFRRAIHGGSTEAGSQAQRTQDRARDAITGLASVTLFLLLALLGSVQLPATAQGATDSAEQNWPQWRGPHQNGVAPFGNPPTEWSETKNVRWRVKLPGDGTATPIVWNDYVFIQTAVPSGKKAETSAAKPDSAPPDGNPPSGNGPGRRRGGGMTRPEKPNEVYQFVLICFDRKTGKTLWQKVAREQLPHEGYRQNDGSFASSSAVTDGKHVFAWFGSRGLHCYDLQGNLKWEKDFGRMQIKMQFGEGSSPALFGRSLVINWDHEGDDFIAALDTETGKELWRQPREEDTSWATPLVVQHGGKAQVVTDASRRIRSYDLASGKLMWECAGLTANVIPSPVAGGDMVYCMSGFRGNALLAIRLGQAGDLTGTDAIAWKHDKATPYVPSPLLYGDRLYFLSSNNGILSCFDAATGKALFEEERLEGMRGVYASPVGAADRVYIVGRDGAAVVLKKSDKPEVLATNKLDDRFDASPAVAGNELFLRGHEYLYCIAGK